MNILKIKCPLHITFKARSRSAERKDSGYKLGLFVTMVQHIEMFMCVTTVYGYSVVYSAVDNTENLQLIRKLQIKIRIKGV